MTPLTIYPDSSYQSTVVPNYFIDELMSDANAAQIKIYIYLLRRIGAGLSTSMSEMADFLNYPEKDITRALKYWEKKGLLKILTDENNVWTGIHLLSVPTKSPSIALVTKAEITTASVKEEQSISKPVILPTERFAPTTTAPVAPSPTYVKPTYTTDDIKSFKNSPTSGELLFLAETYLRRQLSMSDIQTIYFFSDTLKMSNDLIDYLFQYCIERGKTDFHYIEKIAINWVENGIKTPAAAKEFSYKYAKIVYTVMKALGKSTIPTQEEATYVQRWSNDMGFTDEIILEACRRSVTGTDKNRLQYADTILNSWKLKHVISLNDIEKLDEDFKKKKVPTSTQKPNYKKGSFYQFEQRDYDFDALEKLLSN